MAWTTLYSATNGTSSGGYGYTRRIVIAATALATTANTVRVLFHYSGTGSYAMTSVYIGLQATSGDAWDIDPTTMVRLTQGGNTTFTITSGAVYSDSATLVVDGTRAVVISLYGGTSLHYLAGTVPAGLSTYHRSGDYAGTADASSFSTSASNLLGFRGLEGDTIIPDSVPVAAALEQVWGDAPTIVAGLAQAWGLRMPGVVAQPWANAPVRRSGLVQPWDSTGVLVAPLAQRWQDLAAIRSELAQPWQVFGPVAAGLDQPWAVLSAAAQGLLAQPWNLPDRDTLATALAQPWSIGADASLLRYTVAVLAAGQPVRVSHINIEGDLGQDVLTCEIHPETEAEYLRCALGAALQVTVTSAEATSVFHFVVTSPRIDEQHGQTRYVVEAMSPAVLLGEPWATPIDGERSGLASAIAASLAAPATLDWQTVDWSIPGATLIASQQTPLALLKQVAAAVGAVVQSQPDGSIRVLPEYPLAVPAWAIATPDQSLTETLDLFTTASTPDIRSGHNKFLVGDQMTAADTLRLEEEALTATTKLVRGYQTPWIGAFSLRHTGGAWVQIEPLGIETRQQTETIEIVAGSGRTQYPIVSRDAVSWGQVNLGSVTFSEDGTLSASVAGESLLTLTYTTRCRKWQVRDPNNEQLQLVADL